MIKFKKMQKPKPSYTDEEIWHQAGERGCYSGSAQHFKSCFDILVHREGILMYRMKRKSEMKYSTEINDNDSFLFKGVLFHDPMEIFIPREEDGDNIVIMDTHNKKGKKHDYWEAWCSVPYEEFKHYLDPATPMDCFMSDVESHLASERR
jgi:hypothetical protein